MHRITNIFSLMLLLLFSIKSIAQTDEDKPRRRDYKSRKGFHTGVYTGAYFANKSTAGIYDGYGFDPGGNKNNFAGSFMNQSINYYYGGKTGLADQIAPALGVGIGQWHFDQTDMPLKMKYNPGILVGIHMMYGFTQKNALIFNASGTRLTLNGSFTIVLDTASIGPKQPGHQDLKACSITGAEQRMLFQIGYRRILGEDEVFNFFIEGGAALNMTKLVGNQITINNLQINLASYYSYPNYFGFREKYLSGVGLGAFAGFGLNLTANPKCNLQLIYNSFYEKIKIGIDPKLKFQHSIGLRIYYVIAGNRKS
ncbi:MAG: hypothetical protein HY840_01425 [Bacteroidetes bacterium]|nr:hypothetical protein [Bacteroidota bacterium]